MLPLTPPPHPTPPHTPLQMKMWPCTLLCMANEDCTQLLAYACVAKNPPLTIRLDAGTEDGGCLSYWPSLASLTSCSTSALFWRHLVKCFKRFQCIKPWLKIWINWSNGSIPHVASIWSKMHHNWSIAWCICRLMPCCTSALMDP